MEKIVNTQPVLDKGFVGMVDHMGSDLTVCNAARVSFNKESEWHYDDVAYSKIQGSIPGWVKDEFRELSEKDKKLVNFLSIKSDLQRMKSPVGMFNMSRSFINHHGEVNPKMVQNREVMTLLK